MTVYCITTFSMTTRLIVSFLQHTPTNLLLPFLPPSLPPSLSPSIYFNSSRNEEMQSVRTFKSADISEIIMKAKYIHNIYQEFKDAVRTGALAISDGHIAPMNPLDAEKAHVYVYNNIFYSQAVESKESFKICDGDVASRKLAGHDLKNQKLIQSFDLDGLCTVLSCIVDFKGARLIGQTIIPGVLQVGVHSARLLYGAIERGKRLTVKNEGLKIMNSLFSELFVVERKITATPTFTLFPTGEHGEGIIDPTPLRMDYFGLTEEENQSTSVEIDFEDDVVEPTSEVVPHVGCLEIKLLKGTDGRAYVLDAMRLTPIDANYVKGPKSTGNIPVETLALVNNNVSTSYVLRYELISSYSQHKVSMLRQDMIRTELQNHRAKLLRKELAKELKLRGAPTELDPALAISTANATATEKDEDKEEEKDNENDKQSTIEEREGHEEEKGCVVPATAVTAVVVPVSATLLGTARVDVGVNKDPSPSSTSTSALLRAQAPAFVPQNKNDNNATASKNEVKEGQVKENTDAVKEEKNETEQKKKSEGEDKVEENEREEEDGRDEDEESEEDLISKFDELTHQNMGLTLQLNANCFIDGFECDEDPVVALKDEEAARDIAHYLFKQVTVSLTEQV